jgi:membrane-associated phospholipid phosphatase
MRKAGIRLSSAILFACVFIQAGAQNKTIGTSGDVLLFAIPATTLAVTLLKEDNQGSWQFAKGLIVTEAITYGLKLSIIKERPDKSNENAFPSGHTATVFHSASFVHRRYGFEASIPLYALAGLTAFTRLNATKHDGIDLFAGAVIGIGSALLFTSKYEKRNIELTYVKSEGNYLFGLRYNF